MPDDSYKYNGTNPPNPFAGVNPPMSPGYTRLAGSNLSPGTAAGLAGQVFNIGAQLYTNYKDREFQREMLAGEQDFAREMWNANNAYNTPKAQVQRLKLAGLNPALMYGSMSDAGNAELSGSPGGAAPNQVAPQVDPYMMSQIANLEADTRQKEAQTELTAEEVASAQQTTRKLRHEADSAGAKAFVDLSNQYGRAVREAQENGLASKSAEEQMKYVARNTHVAAQILEQNLTKAINEAKISGQDYERAKKEVEIARERLKQVQAQTKVDEYAADHAAFTYWFNIVNQALGTIGDIIGAIIGLRKFGIKIPLPDNLPSSNGVLGEGNNGQDLSDTDIPHIYD